MAVTCTQAMLMRLDREHRLAYHQALAAMLEAIRAVVTVHGNASKTILN